MFLRRNMPHGYYLLYIIYYILYQNIPLTLSMPSTSTSTSSFVL